MEQRLSAFLTSQIEMYDMDGSGRPSEQESEARRILERIAETLIEAREAFTGEEIGVLERALQNEPGITEAEIDRALSSRALGDVSAMVERTVHLSKLTGLRIPSTLTATYIREAARTYVYGFVQASAAMSRASLEQALKERSGHQGDEDFIRFHDLVKEGEIKGLLDKIASEAIRSTAKKANRVLHAALTDRDGALELLVASRGLIQHIFDAKVAP